MTNLLYAFVTGRTRAYLLTRDYKKWLKTTEITEEDKEDARKIEHDTNDVKYEKIAKWIEEKNMKKTQLNLTSILNGNYYFNK